MSKNSFLPSTHHIKPVWMESLERIDRLYSNATKALLDSGTIAAITELNNKIERSGQFFRESVAEQSMGQALTGMRKDILEPFGSNTMKAVNAAISSNSAAQVAERYAELVENYASTSANLAKLANQAALYSESASYKALREITSRYSDDRINELLDIEVDENEFDGTSFEELDEELTGELSGLKDIDSLSERAKKLIYYLYHAYILPILLSCYAAHIMFNWEQAQEQFKDVSTPSQVRTVARNSSSQLDLSALNNFRVTIADSLNFRSEPKMKSEVITTIPLGTVVEIIDKTNRSWLYVEIEIEGEPEKGWISRAYTKRLR